MKVYVIKEISTWGYFTETRVFINDLRQADLFLDYEVAQCYCPSGCEVVEVQLMETTELTDYTKQVRKEVIEKIKRDSIYCHINREVYYKVEPEILDQIQNNEGENYEATNRRASKTKSN